MNFQVVETPSLKSYSAPLKNVNLLAWVKNEKNLEKFYFKLRDEPWEWAGSGNLLVDHKMTFNDVTKIFEEANSHDIKIFVAQSFDLISEKSRFILPRFEITKIKDRLTFKVNFWKDENSSPDLLNSVVPQVSNYSSLEKSGGNKEVFRVDKPNQEEWTPYFNKAQDFLEVHSKVVLARVTEAKFEEAIDPFFLLESLRQESYRCYWRLPTGQEVVSVSPERLFKIEGRKLTTEAIAGTKPVDADHNELLESPKERAEHQYVVDEILRQLKPFATDIEAESKPRVVAFKKVLHLKTPISAQLKSHVSILELIKAIHPTPAVGGLPKTEALQWLESHEPFNREYYAAPFGVVGQDFAEFFVNIRSVLIDQKNLKLYSGVGVVKDSIANSEWTELDLKTSQFWEALS